MSVKPKRLGQGMSRSTMQQHEEKRPMVNASHDDKNSGNGIPSVDFSVDWIAGMRHLQAVVPHAAEDQHIESFYHRYDLCVFFTADITERPFIDSRGTMVMPPIIGLKVESRESLESEEFSYFRMIPVFTVDPPPMREEYPEYLNIQESPPNMGSVIAGHVWDAGVAVAAFARYIFQTKQAADAQSRRLLLGELQSWYSHTVCPSLSKDDAHNIIELGAGCAPLSSAVAMRLRSEMFKSFKANENFENQDPFKKNFNFLLTDQDSNEDLGTLNLNQSIINHDLNLEDIPLKFQDGFESSFVTLNWDSIGITSEDADDAGKHDLPSQIRNRTYSLILASDVTYNSASLPALVRTVSAVCESSSQTAATQESTLPLLFFLAMKVRHSDEDIFWELMCKAGFGVIESTEIWCPHFYESSVGEDGTGDWVYIYVFKKA